MFGVKFTLNFLLFRLPKPIGFPNTPFRKRDSHFLNERFLKSQAHCSDCLYWPWNVKGWEAYLQDDTTPDKTNFKNLLDVSRRTYTYVDVRTTT